MSPAQQEFNATYITATEIATEMDVSRESVYKQRMKDALPDAILVGKDLVYIWKRAQIRPYIDAWKRDLAERRAHTA